jgi:hypothetical protein
VPVLRALAAPALLGAVLAGCASAGPAPVAPAAETPVAAAADQDAPAFDPDATDLRTLIFWDSLTGEGFLTAPDSLLRALDALAASGHPGADKYLVDLANVPTPYATRILDHLRTRFGRPGADRLSHFPELAQPPPGDRETAAYLEFKQQLFGTILPAFALFLSERWARTIDAREVRYGGVGVDVIPPLEFPSSVSAGEAAAWLRPDDAVVGVSINGDARAFPVRIIARHEMVNDTVGGVPVSLAYCTLCGSAIAYDGRLRGEVYRFGTSGLLYRSNKLMYDRSTRTLWNQFTGEPAWGELVGQGLRLRPIASTSTTWGAWLAANPATSVLDIETGYPFDYASGSAYAEYNASDELMFAVPVDDGRLAPRDEVFVVRTADGVSAYAIADLRSLGVVNDRVGDRPIVVVATADGMGARAFERGERRFRAAGPAGALVDESGGRWTVTEDALTGPGGETLPRVNGGNAFWFAVANFAGESRLYGAD